MPLANFRPVVDDPLFSLRADVPDLAGAAAAAGLGDVDPAVVANDQVVAANPLGDHRGLAAASYARIWLEPVATA